MFLVSVLWAKASQNIQVNARTSFLAEFLMLRSVLTDVKTELLLTKGMRVFCRIPPRAQMEVGKI